MSSDLDSVMQAAVIGCFRQLWKKLGYSAASAGAAIHAIDETIAAKTASEAVYKGSIKKDLQRAYAGAVLKILKGHREAVEREYTAPGTRSLLRGLFDGEAGGQPPLESSGAFQEILHGWADISHERSDLLGPGLYQSFRRYKPLRETKLHDWSQAVNHVVICELIYFDPNSPACYLVTSEGQKYRGIIHINHEEILFVLLQRYIRAHNGYNHRFFAAKLHSKDTELISGLFVKVGDTTHRPLASETILRKIPGSHAKLIEAFQKDVVGSFDSEPVVSESIIYDYITSNPPLKAYDQTNPHERWRRVRFVREFPVLTELVKSDVTGISYLREPSRSLSVEDILELLGSVNWPVFVQSTSEIAGTDEE